MSKFGFYSFRFGRLRQHALPVLVWLAALVCVTAMFRHRASRFEVLGLAQGKVYSIAATCDGRVKSMEVELFEEVKAGDVLVVIDTVLDNENLEAELAPIAAEIQRLQAEMSAEHYRLTADTANQQNDLIEAKRRFEVDVESARLRVLGLKATIETDRIRLDDLKLNTKISALRSISDQNDTAQYGLQKTGLEYSALAKKIEENERLLAQAQTDLDQSLQRRDEFEQQRPQPTAVDSALDVIRKSITVQEQLMAQISARREPLVLRAPIDGVVSQVLQRPVRRTDEGVVRELLLRSGETVMAGESILTVTAKQPSEIIAWLDAEQCGRVTKGMQIKVIKETTPQQIAVSKITDLGPFVELMPQCLWMVPNIPQWGRPVVIEVPPGLNIIPGEIVALKTM
jgi:multidrug resistance efflux pump